MCRNEQNTFVYLHWFKMMLMLMLIRGLFSLMACACMIVSSDYVVISCHEQVLVRKLVLETPGKYLW